MVNINKFNVGDIVTVCIPPKCKYLYARIDDTITHRITEIVSLLSDDPTSDQTRNWYYEIDNDNTWVAEKWIIPCDEDIEPVDIGYIIGI